MAHRVVTNELDLVFVPYTHNVDDLLDMLDIERMHLILEPQVIQVMAEGWDSDVWDSDV